MLDIREFEVDLIYVLQPHHYRLLLPIFLNFFYGALHHKTLVALMSQRDWTETDPTGGYCHSNKYE